MKNAGTALQRQYYICSEATEALKRAQNDLSAAQLKLDTEKRFLAEAQEKLANLVNSKKNADDAVNKYLSDISKYNVFATGVSADLPRGGVSKAAST